MIVGGVIFSFNGQRQRFNSSKVQRRSLLGMLLGVLKPAQMHAVGAVDQTCDRNDQHPSLPSQMAFGDFEQTRGSGARKVIRQAHQIATRPYSTSEYPSGK